MPIEPLLVAPITLAEGSRVAHPSRKQSTRAQDRPATIVAKMNALLDRGYDRGDSMRCEPGRAWRSTSLSGGCARLRPGATRAE